jgi:very-short-patch-repair endonuclease
VKLATDRVRELRRDETEAERRAWYLLRDRRTLGLKFHRQYRIGNNVVDFYCFGIRLAIELDGGVHSQPSQAKRDAAKDEYLRSLGIRVLRVPNGLVLQDPEAFRAKISTYQLPLEKKKVTPHPTTDTLRANPTVQLRSAKEISDPSPGSLGSPPSPQGRGLGGVGEEGCWVSEGRAVGWIGEGCHTRRPRSES